MSLIDEADGANIGVNDLICMMLQIGASDTALQRELGAIKNPTQQAFNMKIEGFEQARKTTASIAFENAAYKPSSQRQLPPSNQPKNNNRPSNNRGKGERDRRLALRGRCFLPRLTPSLSVPVRNMHALSFPSILR